MARARRPAQAQPPRRALALRLAFVLPVLAALVTGIAGGLARAGVSLPSAVQPWWSAALVGHAFLMICCFMGSVIALERAVAVKHPLAFAGPVASTLGGLAWLAGWPQLAAGLVAGASLAFIAVNLVVLRRQRAAHTVLLLVAALAWAVGCTAHALGLLAGAVIPLWFAFLILTIAAERLEMTRLMRRHAGAAPALYLICAALLAGALLSALVPAWGGALYGLSLLVLALWLLVFDIARRTLRAQGLSRYMAVCLLLGYAWLGVAGAAWWAATASGAWRDTALHGLALGFVFSMMLGHAPVILPAIARIKVLFGWAYYLPLALLHASLLLRLAVPGALQIGALGNALAIVGFAATVAASAVAWRLKYSSSKPPPEDELAVEH